MGKMVIVSGGFDPLHSGHIEYLKAASQLGIALIVGVNSDNWLIRKKGNFFMTQADRMNVLGSLKAVSYVLSFDDSDGSACDLIRKTIKIFGKHREYIFANGGDRTSENIPEMKEQYDAIVLFTFGVGGGKINSSSDILKRWIEINTR